MAMCYCGSERDYDACCGLYVSGAAQAPTAEALMRARYSAHCVGDFDYLDASVHPDVRDASDHEAMRQWSEAVEWQGLEIVSISGGQENDEYGKVSFIAHYAVQGMPQKLQEDAEFKKEHGQWFYVDGFVHGQEPVRRETPKVGRNEPCPCGSGKKFKKCCAQK